MPTDVVLTSLAWLGTYLVHSTLLLGGVWLATKTPLLAAPRLRERMWRLALFGGVLTASLQLFVGSEPMFGRLAVGTEPIAEVETELPASAGRGLGEAIPSGAQIDLSLPHTTPEASPARELPFGFGNPDFGPDRSNPHETRVAFANDRPVRQERSEHVRRSERAVGIRAARADFAPAAAPTSVRERPHTHPADSEPLSTEAAGAPTRLAVLGSLIENVVVRRVRQFSWHSGLVALWVVIGGLGLVWFAVACARLLMHMNDRREIVAGPLADALERLAMDAGMRGRVRLYASPTLAAPMTYGWLRRRICIPLRALTDLSPGEQQSMLAHELAHAKRRDPLWFSVYTLSERVLFFQPLNRLARRELHDVAEILCDDWAVRWTGNKLSLASCLAEVAQWLVGRRRLALPQPGMAGRHPSRLGVRVERLLDDDEVTAPEPKQRWWSPVALSSLGLIVFAAPGVSSTPTRRPAPSPAPADSVLAADLHDGADEPDASDAHTLEFAFGDEFAPSDSANEPLASVLDMELVGAELTLLDASLARLRASLDGMPHAPRFEDSLRRIQNTIDSLHARRERLNELLALVPNPALPTATTRNDGRK